MAAALDHTIVHARDREASARFLAEMFDLSPPRPFGPFLVVEATNGVSLDFLETDEPFSVEHYAFLVSEDEFDGLYARVRARSLPYWADPHREQPGRINHRDGGRGIYFEDPSGHVLEAITRPYGSGG